MMMEMCLHKRERRQPRHWRRRGGNEGVPVPTNPWGVPPPCPPYSFALVGSVDEPSLLYMVAKGEEIS
jgi:hypothetical protein